MENAFLTIKTPFLRGLEVIDENGLRIVVEERSGLGPPESDLGEILGIADLGTSQEMIPSREDGVYEIVWPVAVCFAVRGDYFPKGGPRTETISEESSDSPFISWVKSDSHTGSDYLALLAGHTDDDRPLRHWVVRTNQAHFDVASPYHPQVTRR
jgi:hypothetical protein